MRSTTTVGPWTWRPRSGARASRRPPSASSDRRRGRTGRPRHAGALVLEQHLPLRVTEVRRARPRGPTVMHRHLRLRFGQIAGQRASSASGSPGGTSPSGDSRGAHSVLAPPRARVRPGRVGSARTSCVRCPSRSSASPTATRSCGSNPAREIEEGLRAGGQPKAAIARRRPPLSRRRPWTTKSRALRETRVAASVPHAVARRIDRCAIRDSGGAMAEGRIRRKNGREQRGSRSRASMASSTACGEVVAEPDVPVTAEPAAR